jgi:hypothetical protein
LGNIDKDDNQEYKWVDVEDHKAAWQKSCDQLPINLALAYVVLIYMFQVIYWAFVTFMEM